MKPPPRHLVAPKSKTTLLVKSRKTWPWPLGGLFPNSGQSVRPLGSDRFDWASRISALAACRVFERVMKPVVVRFPSRLTSSRAFRYNSTPFGGRPSGAAFLFCGVRAPAPREAGILSLYKELDEVNTRHATSAIVPTYARADVAFERGDGCWLCRPKGERYLDFGAGIAVASLGHSHPHLVETLTSQGAQAVAHLEPVSDARGRAVRPPSGRRELRRSGVLRQFRR